MKLKQESVLVPCTYYSDISLLSSKYKYNPHLLHMTVGATIIFANFFVPGSLD